MISDHIIIVPTTHWDREWYLPFNEYRAYLVLMLDKLNKILDTDPFFTNFTLDGQSIPLEDYLEVRPDKEEKLKQFVKEGRLSIGPMYVLPDEFLISGESLIRNLFLGHKVSKKFGKVMKAGYIPDPFGHIAQLPQILSGFEIPSTLFARGFGNEFKEQQLNMEFIWNAPGKAASVLAIHLIQGYFSAANLNTTQKEGKYKKALNQLKRIIKRFEKYTTTSTVLLNNGSDHLYPQPEVPEIVKQWNSEFPNKKMEINDFEYYIECVLQKNPELKEFEGELRGGKYMPLLSGVFSARMWIKQQNTEIEYLYEKYTEPISAITWALDKYDKFQYPKDYIWTGLKWLLKNHPHDGICGCSIDEVHKEMKTRFQWSKHIGTEIIKNSMIYLSDLIKVDDINGKKFVLIIFNPLPWKRKDIVYFDVISHKETKNNKCPDRIKLTDFKGSEIAHQSAKIEELPRYKQIKNSTYRFSFLAEVHALGYKVYYISPIEEEEKTPKEINNSQDFKITRDTIENEFYRVKVNLNGLITVLDKKSGISYENICLFEDVADWGDEYDFSGPHRDREDKIYYTNNATHFKINNFIDGLSQKTFKIHATFYLPPALTADRLRRGENLERNECNFYISLYKGINRIDFKIEFENSSKDHRIRVLFPTKIKTDTVFADGHFYIVPRNVNLPDSSGWAQPALGTNHQKDFVCVQDGKRVFAVFNKGLPEYEAIKNENGSITLAITLLRCVGWLSRPDLATRGSNAGPDLKTPGAQCLGKHTFEISMAIVNDKKDYLEAGIHVLGKQFNNPLISIIPKMIKTPMRTVNKINLNPVEFLELFRSPHKKEIEGYLPESFGFFEIDNKKIFLSLLKLSETGDSLVARFYNLSSSQETCKIRFHDFFSIENVKIVNFLEEEPINEIKAVISLKKPNIIDLTLQAHVIATLKIEITI
ncbi:MAG: alpha-mannosidase [Candidatus Helarchaeota archaeon]